MPADNVEFDITVKSEIEYADGHREQEGSTTYRASASDPDAVDRTAEMADTVVNEAHRRHAPRSVWGAFNHWVRPIVPEERAKVPVAVHYDVQVEATKDAGTPHQETIRENYSTKRSV